MKDSDFRIQGEPLRIGTSMKYLGVIIDQNLNFTEHLTKMSEKTKKMYYQLLRVGGNTWGSNYKNRKILYQALIESSYTYCASVFINRGLKIAEKLNQIQRPFIINIARCYRTVSTIAAQVVAMAMPLDLVAKKSADEYVRGIRKMEKSLKKKRKRLAQNSNDRCLAGKI